MRWDAKTLLEREEAQSNHRQKWEHYRDTRKGTYEFRSRTRYAAVFDRLRQLGLGERDYICDVGAGEKQFERYGREAGWKGNYLPIDAVVDGTNLETWTPHPATWYVCIEVLEHLYDWSRLLDDIQAAALRGIVITTPNHLAVDVIGCDPTHVSVVKPEDLLRRGMTVQPASWFGTPHDSLIAWGAR
jgi:hypothetical protein